MRTGFDIPCNLLRQFACSRRNTSGSAYTAVLWLKQSQHSIYACEKTWVPRTHICKQEGEGPELYKQVPFIRGRARLRQTFG